MECSQNITEGLVAELQNRVEDLGNKLMREHLRAEQAVELCEKLFRNLDATKCQHSQKLWLDQLGILKKGMTL